MELNILLGLLPQLYVLFSIQILQINLNLILLYVDVASGVTSDYYYYNADVIHAYIIELRDTGRFGFELPPNQILPTAIETWNGIKAILAVIEKQKSA